MLVQHREVGERCSTLLTNSSSDSSPRISVSSPCGAGGIGPPRRGTDALGQPRPSAPTSTRTAATSSHRDHATPLIVCRAKAGGPAFDIHFMPSDVPLSFALLAVLGGRSWRARCSSTRGAAADVRRGGLKLERRYLGESICRCGHCGATPPALVERRPRALTPWPAPGMTARSAPRRRSRTSQTASKAASCAPETTSFGKGRPPARPAGSPPPRARARCGGGARPAPAPA